MGKKDLTKGSSSESEGLTEDEMADLDAFCDQFDLDEVQYEAWTNCHTSLDIRIEVVVLQQESYAAGSKSILYSRCIVMGGGKPSKVKASVQVDWPAGFSEPLEFCFEEMGDVAEDRVGQLIIRLVPE